MGTHPIFESDFDCLTDFKMKQKREKIKNRKKAEIDNQNWKNLKDEEVECIICKCLLKEPITLPCRCGTRMKCTMCRVCWVRMVADDGVTECRSNCPKCNLRLLSWMRSKTKKKKKKKKKKKTPKKKKKKKKKK